LVKTFKASLALAVAMLGAAALPVQAQPVQPASSKPEDTAMDRAQRQADNPLRMILEAGKIRRKNEADAEAPRPAPKAALPAVPALAAAAPALVASPPPTVALFSANSLPAAPLVEALPATGKLVDGVAGTLGALTGPATVPAPAAPKLVTMVEPSLPRRLFDDLGKRIEVVMDLSLRADGTVAEVRFVPPVPRGAQRAVQSAVEQWRYAPMPQATVHRVLAVLQSPDN
jgi:hypothetical protein